MTMLLLLDVHKLNGYIPLLIIQQNIVDFSNVPIITNNIADHGGTGKAVAKTWQLCYVWEGHTWLHLLHLTLWRQHLGNFTHNLLVFLTSWHLLYDYWFGIVKKELNLYLATLLDISDNAVDPFNVPICSEVDASHSNHTEKIIKNLMSPIFWL